MCGIVGFIGQEQAAPILLDGLAHLEYRGYDSAGVAVISAQGKLQVEKAVGRLKVLSEQIHGGADLEGCIGLGHTRWATHGAPNIINSHPHVSENGKFAVIHNGIIENYVEIKEFLIGQGIRFKSETDTEVVAQLLEFYYNECHDFLEAVGRVLRRIEGAYALGMLCADCPDRIIAARKDAPLLLGYGKGCNFLASDVTAIIKHTRDVAYMEDGEVAVLTREGIEVYDALEQKVEKKHFTIDWEVSAAEKGGYQHFMLKEIMEQPEALRRAISPRIKDGRVIFDDLKLPVEKMREFTRIFIVACGSSYHVGMIGKYNLEHLLRRNVEVVLASEFRYSDPIVDDKSLVIVISQSGETLDTMAALREAKKRGGYILSIVNVVGSSIARESDDVLYTWAGPEIAVATTKAYSTQLAVLDMIGLAFGEALGTVKKEELRGHPQVRFPVFQPQFCLLHRPQPRLCARTRGLAQAQGDQLHPFRGLRLRRAQAWHDLAHRGRHARYRARHLRPAFRQGHEQRGRGQGPRRGRSRACDREPSRRDGEDRRKCYHDPRYGANAAAVARCRAAAAVGVLYRAPARV